MAKVRSIGLRDGVPFLSEKRIEAEAQSLLGEYAQTGKWRSSAPVPVDDIVELHLQLAFGIEDL